MAGTEKAREQWQYLLEQHTTAENMESLRPKGDGQFAGHVFEWMHELSFNLDAMAKGSANRIVTTHNIGEPQAPADLRLLDAAGETIKEVQAKAVNNVAARIGVRDGFADQKYDGMGLLAPTEDAAKAIESLDKRLAMPEGAFHDRYEDVKSRVTDHVSHDGVQSSPVSRSELREVAEDPAGHVEAHQVENAFGQLGTAGATGLVAGALIKGVTSVAVHRITTGSFSGMDWSQAGLEAAKAGAKSAVIAMAGQGISLAASHAVAEGAGGVIAEALAGGSLPFAVARGAIDLGAIAHGLATNRLTPPEAAKQAAESITRTGAVWACAAVGQTLIPIPVVGAVIGGVVGQYGSAMLIQGISLAVTARDRAEEWNREYEALLEQTDAIRARATAELEHLHEISERYDMAFAGTVLPRLDRLAVSVGNGTPDEVLGDLADLTLAYGATPLFRTMAEFEAFMLDDELSLTLNLGGTSFTRLGFQPTHPTGGLRERQ